MKGGKGNGRNQICKSCWSSRNARRQQGKGVQVDSGNEQWIEITEHNSNQRKSTTKIPDEKNGGMKKPTGNGHYQLAKKRLYKNNPKHILYSLFEKFKKER